MNSFEILLRFMRSPEEGPAYYGGLRDRIEQTLETRARDVSDSARHGSVGCHALLVRAPGVDRDDALARVRGAVRDAAIGARTCTAVSVTAWVPGAA